MNSAPNNKMQTIAFHLPQFHPIPENNEWWGEGFTEWTNVTRARPVVPGHYQPHLPSDLGFYDLRLPEARAAQAAMARKYGITGFCYYHYWFTGRRILERPVADILALGEPDFPFCLCWANENWTRAWDGRSGQVLLGQDYSDTDDERHIETLIPYMSDRRYIRIDDRPLFLVYRSELIPDPRRSAEIWRAAAQRAGLGNLFIVRVEGFEQGIEPASIGFDAALEFAPDWRRAGRMVFNRVQRLASYVGLFPKGYFEHRFADYRKMMALMLAKPVPPYPWYRCATPGFDNSARRKSDATIFVNGTPDDYQQWLTEIARRELVNERPVDQKMVFVNAWNEWAEGNHLEPDQKWGTAYLEATRNALEAAGASAHAEPASQISAPQRP
jgi:lipopolysaccharide biosynthesis protein